MSIVETGGFVVSAGGAASAGLSGNGEEEKFLSTI